MVMLMSGLIRVMMYEWSRLCIFIMVRNSVHQDFQPAPFPGRDRDRRDSQHLRQTVQVVRDFQLKYNVPIFIGEFSAIAWAPGAERYLEDCISIFEEYGWDWTYHAFREWTGWSVEHGGVFENQFPVENSPRKQVLKKYFERNRE